MSLTRCPSCRRHCFTDAASCPSCQKVFQPGVLLAQFVAKENAFSRKASALFLAAFLTLLAALVFVQLQAYSNASGLLRL
jgi:hypothetical protein